MKGQQLTNHRQRLRGLFFALLLAWAPLHAAEWMTFLEPAVGYDGPSLQAQSQYVFYQGTPVEILVKLPTMAKVRDADGAVLWVLKNTLGPLTTVIVTGRVAAIYPTQQPQGAPLLEVAKGVVLESVSPLAPPTQGYLSVRHRNGVQGYVAASNVWPVSAPAAADTPTPIPSKP